MGLAAPGHEKPRKAVERTEFRTWVEAVDKSDFVKTLYKRDIY